MRSLLWGLFLICELVIASGCLFFPHLREGIVDLGVTAEDRKRLLTPEITKFHQAVDANRLMMALSFVAEDHVDEIKQQLRRTGREERIMERNLEVIEFDDDAKVAEVEVLVRYYRLSQPIVKDRYEHERWEYDRFKNWRLTKRDFSPVE